MTPVIDLVRSLVAPFRAETLDEPLHRLGIAVVRTEVPCSGIVNPVLIEPLCKREIAGKRLQNMLPRTDRMGVPDENFFPFQKGTDAVGDEPIQRPVPAADNIPCPG